ncbi:3-dehydroquinate dehydratase I |uniref:3-dehydroquinate dehydratase n=1 Tax=hydrothermal vent metagenome TaxID=652676 RepID=A0A1W1CH28_9ZZZZ
MIFFKKLALNTEQHNKPIIASSFVETEKNDLQKYFKNGVDIAEIRIDKFSSFEQEYVLNALDSFIDVPTIATIRSPKEDENSDWNKSESERLKLFEKVIEKVDAVDIEYRAGIVCEVISEVRKNHKTSIVSFHNFEETPSFVFLDEVVVKAKSLGADIVKIATQVNNDNDLKTLTKLLLEHKNLIVIGMGEKGVISRIAFPFLGSLLTFAYAGKSTASGQLNYQETLKIFQKIVV